MTTLIKTIFPEGNTQDVAFIQSTLGLANLILNGNLASGGSVSFTALGYARQISFISTGANLSSATFTIYGMQNGAVISEPVIGPAGNATVYSALVYDIITAISVNIAVTGVSVGTGYNGFFNLITVNATTSSNYTFSLGATLGTNQISTTVYSTLDNIAANGQSFATMIAGNVGTLFPVKSVSATNLYICPVAPLTTTPLINQILIVLTGSISTISNSTTLIYRQTT